MNHIRPIEAEQDEPWSLRHRVVLCIAVSALLWAVLIFAMIGVVAVFGRHL